MSGDQLRQPKKAKVGRPKMPKGERTFQIRTLPKIFITICRKYSPQKNSKRSCGLT
jgi:hypothetical protein